MTDWFRSWHGAPTDPKWLGIARHAGIAPGIAVAIAWALMDRASQAEDRGSIAGYDADGLACFFGCEPEQVEAVVASMTAKGMISDGRFSSWERRQPKREDDSSKRVKAWREKQKETHGDGAERAVTQRNAPEAETETEEDTEKTAQRSLPVRFSAQALSKALFEAAGIAGFRDERHPRLLDLSPIYGLLEAGYDLHRDILPVITERAPNATFSSWRFFEKAIIETAEKNRSIPRAPPAKSIDWGAAMQVWRDNSTWSPMWGPKPGERGCRVPPELLRECAA